MNKVAIFGKPGSGKSTLSKNLSRTTGISLHQLDSMTYKPNGDLVESHIYESEHEKILCSDSWIIDGLGSMNSFYRRLETADTLIYIDLPYRVSYWYVTKRLLKGLFIKPEGWPEGSSIIKGTIKSYQVLQRCPNFWNDNFAKHLATLSESKSIFIIHSVAELNTFIHKKQLL
ncbi:MULTISPECIES: P-loop NTPase family protein [Thalassotalea]|uniref:adenylate kinase n=1 Tax=Thalassotalea TaxID=1518149 RepID=UPI0009427B7F|nr:MULTISPECIES: adenylate kinase [Thalassotalea]OKY25405.1 adenylate kinase [Thalassotalea sp. PP2-459]